MNPHRTPMIRDLGRCVAAVGTGALIALVALAMLALPAQAMRIKEVASVQGVRSNALTGYGIVVGLDGTGDQTTQTPFTTQSIQAMLQHFADITNQQPGQSGTLRRTTTFIANGHNHSSALRDKRLDTVLFGASHCVTQRRFVRKSITNRQ